MILRLFGAGALALAMLLFTLSTPPAYAKQCGQLDRSRGAIIKIDCPTFKSKETARERRSFRSHKAQRASHTRRVHRDADRQRSRGEVHLREVYDNDGRVRMVAASRSDAPVRLARGGEASDGGEGIAAQILPHPPGCPRRAFCGCGAAVRIFGEPIRSLWLAANWLRRFPPAAPGPGMVAARSGHVFVIEQVISPGKVIAYDANSGRGLTRRHVRSLAGFSVRDPRAG